jgi:hypothetical protein
MRMFVIHQAGALIIADGDENFATAEKKFCARRLASPLAGIREKQLVECLRERTLKSNHDVLDAVQMLVSIC